MSANETTASPESNDSGMAAKDPAKRRRVLLIVAGIFILIGLAWFLLWLFVFSTRETTDNAYVGGNQVTISSQVPGTVVAILADDTEHVKAGQVLVKLDSTDATCACARHAVRWPWPCARCASRPIRPGGADAGVAARKVQLAQAQSDLKRHLPLLAAHAESPEIVQHLRDGVAQAQAALATAEAQAKAAHAAIAGTDIAQNPAVEQARANFRAAWVASERNTIVAPVSGYVAQRSVQLGSSVAPGQQLMTVVPLHHLWVDANFKENQLRHIRIGQPVKITTDLYGDDVTYHGKVVGMGAGTGSVFSLLPAQNATGNWIKVVQRVPVRISLDDKELDKHPLRVGLSADAVVDIKNDNGPVLAPGEALPAASTSVYDQIASQADAEADKIIRANLGSASH
ncbi:efflux RND transporter periplasmic adaptor subunit [Rhodanobacter sp. 115]|uniref:HlyD family secretion protein n=1 Tax=Rhodanobacter sp. FW021-MT20 TaxID=1162282 RepID=UPI000260CE50|nr:efflux RND transporter periplasmic adaptor subunit [Rhodanobacter sp. 115]EIL92168.1 multidrug efflux system protein EmrA [Rhodanobacter sp. 115]